MTTSELTEPDPLASGGAATRGEPSADGPSAAAEARAATRGGVWAGVRRWLPMLFILAAFAAFSLYELRDQDMDSDELTTSRVIRMPTQDLIRERLRKGHPPLYFLLAKGWVTLSGHRASTLVGLSVMIAATSIVLFHLLCRELGLGRWAWAGTLLWGLHPTVIYFGRYARPYAGVDLFIVAGLWLTLLALRRKDAPSYLALGAVGALAGAWNHLLLLFWAGILLALALIGPLRRDTRRGLWLALAVPVAVHGAFLILIASMAGSKPIAWIEKPRLLATANLFLELLGGRPLWIKMPGWTWTHPALLAVGTALGCWAVFNQSSRSGARQAPADGGPPLVHRWQVVAMTTLVPLAIMVWVTFTFQPLLVRRYMNILLPGAVLFGVWLLAFMPYRRLAQGLLVAALTTQLTIARQEVRTRDERGMQKLVRALAQHYVEGEDVVLAFNQSSDEAIELFSGHTIPSTDIYREMPHELAWPIFRSLVEGKKRLWIYCYRHQGSLYYSPHWEERAGKLFYAKEERLCQLYGYNLPAEQPAYGPDSGGGAEAR